MSWMKNLDDNMEIGSIKAIPKTHNSCAVNPLKKMMKIPWMWAKCQKYDISQQVYMGVRAFDLRLNPISKEQSNKNNIMISHTLMSDYTLLRVMNELSIFLQENPDEFIFLFLNSEWKQKDNWDENSLKVMWEIINRFDIIENDVSLKTPIKVVRGRIIPIPESYVYSASYCNGKLNEDAILTNISWNLDSLEKVKKSIVLFLRKNLNPEKLLELQLNYIPYKGVFPPMMVSYLTNNWFLKSIFSLYSINNHLGFVGVDFINQNITEAIYVMNL